MCVCLLLKLLSSVKLALKSFIKIKKNTIEQQTRGVTRLSNINCEIMLRLLLLVVALSSVVGGEITLAGIEFGDNFGQEYLTAENGIAIARTEVN